jgi:hypothetical protein
MCPTTGRYSITLISADNATSYNGTHKQNVGHIGMAPCAEPVGKGESKRTTQLQPPTPPGPVQLDQLFGAAGSSSFFGGSVS